jgi:hypothetical protein
MVEVNGGEHLALPRMPHQVGSGGSWFLNGVRMKNAWMLLVSFILSGCVTTRRPVAFVPAKEASWFKFSSDLPTEGQVKIPGTVAAAIQLVVDDFVPWDDKPPSGADTFDACLLEQASYDVEAAPGSEGVVFVSISMSPGACGPNKGAFGGAVYAVDVRNWRILAIQH